MNKKSIRFVDVLARAILDGRKTQTRRIIDPQPYLTPDGVLAWADKCVIYEPAESALLERCPWGRPGDCLIMPYDGKDVRLTIVDVRVERLQAITDADARAEGIRLHERTVTMYEGIYASGFALLWDSIYERRGYGWRVNPWVWVIEFELETPVLAGGRRAGDAISGGAR